jgi:predicted acyl esterase
MRRFKEAAIIGMAVLFDALSFNKGHRVRVLISSSNSPRFDPNPNTGHAFRANKQTRVATNTVHLSAGNPSRIILPIYRESTPGHRNGKGQRSQTVGYADVGEPSR